MIFGMEIAIERIKSITFVSSLLKLSEMGLIYEKKKDDDNDALDFMQLREAQQATQNIVAGSVTSPRPYDVEKKQQVDRKPQVEQRPK